MATVAATLRSSPSLAGELVMLALVLLLAWRFGPWLLRWSGIALVATAFVEFTQPTGGAGGVLLIGLVLWAGGTMWSAARYQRWPGLFSARTLGRLPWPRARA